LSSAFEPISKVTFTYNRLETNPRFATIARQSNASVVARFVVDMEGRGGRLTLLFPYATLEPIRELLLQQFMGEKFGRDSIWEGHMANKLWETEIDLKVILDEIFTPVGNVVRWKKGSFLPLLAQQGDQVNVCSGDVSLFYGDIGQKDGKISVKMQRRDSRLIKS
ncbi:MAG: FliM/FliN family flagellar motor switch protein, partial [Alphaproteobacteria bacterium]|nr:FliM/FliN family flagellar motor switch protein [Alphaproteobacteria bacterium]